MYYLLFIYLPILILAIILSEVFVYKTKNNIRIYPSFGRLLYFGSIFIYLTSLLAYILSNQTSFIASLIMIIISFIFLFFSISLLVKHYVVNQDSIVKSFLFFKKKYDYKDFLLVYSVNRIVAISIDKGRELFSINIIYNNINSFLDSYSSFIKDSKIESKSNVVRSNKLVLTFGFWFGLIGFISLALAIISIIPNIFKAGVPLFASCIFWILAVISLGFSLYCYLYYFFNYLIIESDQVIIHRPFHLKKIYSCNDLLITGNYFLYKLITKDNKVVFFFLINLCDNYPIIFKSIPSKSN